MDSLTVQQVLDKLNEIIKILESGKQRQEKDDNKRRREQ